MADVALDDVDEVLREAFHFDRHFADLAREMVVGDDRGNGGADAGRRRDQRFGNAGSDDGEIRGAAMRRCFETRS